MQLTDNFYLHEFTKSQTALRNGINNTPNQTAIVNLENLCKNILQPVRDYFLLPVFISSGYRSPDLNARIGGSRTSQHCLGQAADIEIFGIDNNELSDWIDKNCKYDQLILEFYDGVDPNSGWVHVSYNEENNRKKYIRADKNEEGKVEYTFV